MTKNPSPNGRKLVSIVLFAGLAVLLTASTPTQKKILIIGDSISIGYTPHVAELLNGKAMVIHNPGNAQHTGTGLEKIREWIGNEHWDIIQFNWGLWDLAYRNLESKTQGNRDKINGVVTFTPEVYQANLDSIVRTIKSISKAKLLFVTTSYVPEGEAGRYVKDGPTYNKAAIAVMNKYQIPVNDIYEFSKTIHPRHGTAADNVHYTNLGSRQLAKKIIEGLGQFDRKLLKCLESEIITAHPNQGKPGLRFPDAIAEARILRAEQADRALEIMMEPGDHYLKEAITIGPILNGLKIKGSTEGSVIIKGSERVKMNWKKQGNLIYDKVSVLDSVHQLFVENRPQILARYPNYDEQGGHWQGHAADALSEGRIAGWQHPAGGFVHAMHGSEWGDFHYQITGVDQAGELILIGGHQNNRPNRMHNTYRMVENIWEELDAPGEFYFNSENRILYWYPDQDDIPETQWIDIPVCNELIIIEGRPGHPVKDIEISGVKFTQTRRTFMENYEPLLRSDWCMYRGGALFMEHAEDCHIEECEFADLGGNAIFLSGYNDNIYIEKNHIHEIGASGVSLVGRPEAIRSPSFQYGEFVPLSEMDTITGPKTEDYPRSCYVMNNLIHRVGRIEKQVAGVQIAMAIGCSIHINSIYDVPRAGINIGDGTWGGHIISNNDVFNTVQESGDHGSFNSWGRDRFWHPNRERMNEMTENDPQMPFWDAYLPTIIRYNRFRCDHGWDIDLDDGSSNYVVAYNLCLNGGIKLREGFRRQVKNNIMINNGFHPHVWFKHSEDVFTNNIVMTDHKDIRLDGWGAEVDYNLFPSAEALAKAQKNGTDMNSLSGNPDFIAPESGDFRVSKNSAALELGFENFPIDFFGVQYPPLKKIRKEPEIPTLFIAAFQKEAVSSRNWLGAQIKNIETLAERSASGLSDESGVLILGIEDNGLAQQAGLQIGDVIIKCEDRTIKTMDDLLQAHSGHNWKGKLVLVAFRNQTEMKITIKTK